VQFIRAADVSIARLNLTADYRIPQTATQSSDSEQYAVMTVGCLRPSKRIPMIVQTSFAIH
jgi:hypothetical protein